MDRYLRGRPKGFGPRGLGAALAVLLTASLLSFDPFDPTATNLLTPAEGIRNVLGLPGAMVGGTLVEWLGASALLIPLLILNWSVARKNRPRLRAYLFCSAALVLIASAVHGLIQPDPTARVLGAGLLGWAGAQWVAVTTGPVVGTALLVAGLAYALTRLVYTIDWVALGRQCIAFARFGLGLGERWAEEMAVGALRALVRGVECMDARIGALTGRAVGIARAVRRWSRALRSSMGAMRRTKPRLRGVTYPRQRAAIPARQATAAGLADGFDAWFTAVGDPAKPIGAAPIGIGQEGVAAEATVGQESKAAPGGASAPPGWEKQFRAYSDNLDLDWEQRVLKAHRVRRELVPWDESEEEDRQDSG
jgi:hypothetical protein